MTAPIAIQLYSLRRELATDFVSIMREIADIGYVGVELIFHLPGATDEEAALLLQQLDLQVAAAHTPLPLDADKNKVLDFMHTFGCDRIIATLGPQHFETLDKVLETCDRFNDAQRVAQEHGMTFGLHNHWWEYEKVGERYVYEIMLDRLEPGILFELDTYWIQAAGFDPAAVVAAMGARAPLIHLKDGPAVQGEPQVALGQGVVDIPAVIAATKTNAKWLIVELDDCATDMMRAVAQSYAYLIDGGWAYGREN